MKLTPNHIVFKVTSYCNSLCYHCLDRRSNYKNKPNNLDLNYAKALLKHFLNNNIDKISFSGGEPTLHIDLIKFVQLAKKYTDNITITTNGWNCDYEYWDNLIRNGVNNVNVSVDGHTPELHDWLRNTRNLHKKLNKLLDIFKKFRKTYPTFSYSIISILSNFNILHLDILLNYILQKEANRWVIHYPEADSDSIFSPTEYKQQQFQKIVIPKMIKTLSCLGNEQLIETAIKHIKSIYDPDWCSPELTSKGVYWGHKTKLRKCKIPSNFLLIKYDGKILPCNGSEYINNSSIGEISLDAQISEVSINTDKLKMVINNQFEYCKNCPVPDTIKILLRSNK